MKEEKRRKIIQTILINQNILTLKEGYREYYLSFEQLEKIIKEYEKYYANKKKL